MNVRLVSKRTPFIPNDDADTIPFDESTPNHSKPMQWEIRRVAGRAFTSGVDCEPRDKVTIRVDAWTGQG